MIPLAGRITAKLQRQPNGCLLWTGILDGSGLPTAKHQGRQVSVRRWCFQQAHPTMLVPTLYPCRISGPRCCEPRHQTTRKPLPDETPVVADRRSNPSANSNRIPPATKMTDDQFHALLAGRSPDQIDSPMARLRVRNLAAWRTTEAGA